MHVCTYKVLPSAVRNKDCEWPNAGFLVAPPKLSRDKRDELALGAFGPIQQSPGQGALPMSIHSGHPTLTGWPGARLNQPAAPF